MWELEGYEQDVIVGTIIYIISINIATTDTTVKQHIQEIALSAWMDRRRDTHNITMTSAEDALHGVPLVFLQAGQEARSALTRRRIRLQRQYLAATMARIQAMRPPYLRACCGPTRNGWR
jgi:hypothetical protein